MNQFYFPAVRDTHPVSQINKAREEFAEFLVALTSESIHQQMEEYWDHIHAFEQLGRDMFGMVGVDFWRARDYVEMKNRAKGLYR